MYCIHSKHLKMRNFLQYFKPVFLKTGKAELVRQDIALIPSIIIGNIHNLLSDAKNQRYIQRIDEKSNSTITENIKCQSILAFANMLLGERESRVGSSMVPLDSALLSCYRLSIVTIPLPLTVLPQFSIQILTGGSRFRLQICGTGDPV